VNHDPITKSYKFRPTHNIFTADDLLSYLQQQTTATGINVRDLKDGWPDVGETIDKLEAEHKLLVSRSKKDNLAKMVWINDPTLSAPLDEEFKKIWESISIPDHKEIIEILKEENFQPAGSIAAPKAKAPVKKTKAKRKSTKVTNVHLKGMLRDFSKR
jgi:transcription initiation factor TFIIE subunit beta